MANIIDGKLVSARLREEIKAEVSTLAAEGRAPGLAVILVGEDPASQVYVRNKEKACEEVGFYSEKYLLDEKTEESELLALIEKLPGIKEKPIMVWRWTMAPPRSSWS